MSPELTNIVLVAAGVLGVVILTIGVVAFIRREVRPKIATPAGLIRPPGDGDLRATRRHHPPRGNRHRSWKSVAIGVRARQCGATW